jgi:hypothetical protein
MLESYYKYKQCDKVNVVISNNHVPLAKAYSSYINKYLVTNPNMIFGFIRLKMRRMLPSNVDFIYVLGYKLTGYKKLSMADSIRIVLELPEENSYMVAPCFTEGLEMVQEIIKKNDLKKGKTVLIAPKAVTLENIYSPLWEKIADYYISNGYSVVTNLQHESEQPIRGTIGLALPLNELYILAEYAGNFIGFRSGLCDMIAYSSCRRKYVIYPSADVRCFDKYTFENLGICSDVIEVMDSDVLLPDGNLCTNIFVVDK